MNLSRTTKLERGDFSPWFLQKTITTLTFPVGAESISLPSDFLCLEDDSGDGLFVYDAASSTLDKYRRVKRDEFSSMAQFYENTETGARPTRYDIIGSSIFVRAIPDISYPAKLIYHAADVDIADNSTTTLWLTYASDWLIAEAGAKLAALHFRDYELASAFSSEAQGAYNRIKTETEKRKHMDMDYGAGDN